MKHFIIAIILLIILGGGGYYAYAEFYKQPAERHIHAGFLVFIDGKQQDFSSVRFMSLEPCDEHTGRKSKEELAHEMAHLHDSVGYIGHSHREGAVWGDLFRNIGYTFDTSKPLTAYVNGKKVDDIFSYLVNAYDSLVILVGNSDKKLVSKAITKEQIVKAEQTSADCGK
ncbi:hypothetical protein BH09PAT2_BH09PAT2_00150 [soil metagenome]